MTYIQSILEPGEQVRYHTTISWTIYTPAILLAICALASAALAGSHAHTVGLGWLAAIAFAVAAVVTFVPAWFRRWTTEITVTDRRVILKRGLIRRHTVEMNMNKIESVDVDQTLLGRMFGFGTIVVRGTGGSLEPIRRIADPLSFRSQITAG